MVQDGRANQGSDGSGRGRREIRPMVVLTSLFFMWGFMTVMNDVLVPHLRAVFTLTYFESMLVQFAFFGAYFMGSLLYYSISIRQGDPIQRIGYKRGLIAGLLLSALGSALFVPATFVEVYALYLIALFVLGLGFTLLQIAANPFVAIIGPPEGASGRLNLAQAFNSLGTTLAPLVGGALIFELFKGTAAVRWPYLFFTSLLVLQAVWVMFTALPEPPRTEMDTRSNAWRHPQLRHGVFAIFCYVGAEVAIGSLLISFLGLDAIMGMPEASAKQFLSLYWGGAMTGRFLGAVALSARSSTVRRAPALFGVGALVFMLLYLLNACAGGLTWSHLWPMAVLMALSALAFLISGRRTDRTLGVFALVAIVLLTLASTTNGAWAMWALVAIGLFNSIMWSNIFTLAIDGLGHDTSQGSSLLVMMIVGGALVPPVQGAIADTSVGLQASFFTLVPLYAYLAWYGLKGARHT
ncbi:MAG: sugar MFS transporter [Flavobacteriales bacterium]|nr:sugar MFS transporter [Flavobacteriales bacterium]MCB9193887.1 sugar MFS transporter [Flavobacteriales bacterium]